MKKVLLWLSVIVIFIAFVKYTLITQVNECAQLQEKTISTLSNFSKCESDSDCTIIGLSCPFECNTPLNTAYKNQAFSAVGAYNKSCMMICPDCPKSAPPAVVCRDKKCVTI